MNHSPLWITPATTPCLIHRQAGAAQLVPIEDRGEIIRRVHALTGERFCDVLIEVVGLQCPLDLAAEQVRERGTLVIAGHHQNGARRSLPLATDRTGS